MAVSENSCSGQEHPPRSELRLWLEVLLVFLRLGLTCFGGPIAHLGYFRNEFVARRKWIDETAYADLVALCSFLPGPTSSQVAFAIGLSRAGWPGAGAAWIGFTLPSAVALFLFSIAAPSLSPILQGALTHGLKLVAVAVVAQAVVGMARSLCPDRVRASIASASVLIIAAAPIAYAQIAAIAFGAIAGFIFCEKATRSSAGGILVNVTPRVGIVAVVVFLVLLIGLPYLARVDANHAVEFFDAFYRSGALVFGGGHVVLPLLNDAVVTPGWVRYDTFLAGYGAAQAVPGPLFSFAAYLGAVCNFSPNGIEGAMLALVAIFLPGFLILIGALPYWQKLSIRPEARAAVSGVSAAVVGILASALFDPLWISSVRTTSDFVAVAIAFTLLVAWRASPVIVVVLGVGWGIASAGHF